MLIYLKECCTISGEIHSNSKKPKLRFKVPSENSPPVIVDIIPGEKRVESFHEFEASKEMWDVLQVDISDGRELPTELQIKLSEVTSDMTRATRKVLYLIKYCFNCVRLNENLFAVKNAYWSIDKSEWKSIPRRLSITIDTYNSIGLDENTTKTIQEYIDNDFEPFLALRHLHRAREESNPRYKWIDATIAAELAIKEFLIKFEPSLKTLLLEVPSPPLDKMYGSILESYTNERSPRLKELKKGAEIRNKLIHRPEDIHIDRRQANKYVHNVQIAIYHLLTLFYPDDPNIRTFYKP